MSVHGWNRPYGDARYHFVDGHPRTYRCGRRRRVDVVCDPTTAVPQSFLCAHCVYCLTELEARTLPDLPPRLGAYESELFELRAITAPRRRLRVRTVAP